MSGSGGYDHYNAAPYGSQPYQDDLYAAPPPPPAHRQIQPGLHQNSNYTQMQNERQHGASPSSPYNNNAISRSPPRRPVGSSPINRERSPSPDMHFGAMPAYPAPTSRSPYHQQPQSQAPGRTSPPRQNGYGGGAAASAVGAGAGASAGFAAMNNSSPPPPGNMGQYAHLANNGYSDRTSEHDYEPPFANRQGMQSHDSYGSDAGLAAAAGTPGYATPRHADAPAFAHYNEYSSPSPSRHLNPNQYRDPSVPTSRSHEQMANAAYINPQEILDDGDDFPMQNSKRGSRVNMAFNKSKSSVNSSSVAGAGAIGDDMAGGFNRDPAGNYSSIPANRLAMGTAEKSEWMKDNEGGSRKKKKLLFIFLGVIIIAGIIAGTVAGVMSQNKSSGNSASANAANAAANDAKNGDLSKDSAEIQKLLNNPNLHKVFSGFAYTPLNTQYPDCLTMPPTQNNVTRDMAMIGQLTNVVRTYGTDCNQTEMVLHAINRLGLTDMKIWLGVWLGNNDTTNTRQIEQMWTILDTYGTSHVKGVVIGNEVLFRKDLTAAQLGTYLTTTKSNLTAKGYNLPVATSDLGDNWTVDLASQVDVVMSNIHPFFAGVTAQVAASWTWDFWQSHDVALTASMTGKKHVISEIGWPSTGGNDCGAATCTSSTQGSIASIDNMNTLMSDWVCQAMANGTDYFWFEGFDEPWKVKFDTATQQWEDKWGLMDIDRNLKSGVKIPNCGGKTVPSETKRRR